MNLYNPERLDFNSYVYIAIMNIGMLNEYNKYCLTQEPKIKK